MCLQSKLSLTLKEYRLLHGAHVRNPGALIYPSTLRYMPAFLLGLVKATAFRCGGVAARGSARPGVVWQSKLCCADVVLTRPGCRLSSLCLWAAHSSFASDRPQLQRWIY